MLTLDISGIQFQHLITHHVGNKGKDEKYLLSSSATTIDNETEDYLLKYFLQSIKTEELYCFTHAVDLALNDIYKIVGNIFTDQEEFIPGSQSIAKLLYEESLHPKINEGNLNIAYFSKVVYAGRNVDAIGIFKSETNVPFIKMEKEHSKFSIHHDYGFELKGMDKGCIIFNTDGDKGYKVLIIDQANRSSEAQYWKDDFLKLKPISNEFHQTSQFLGITKSYVTEQISEEFEISKADKIDLLNRSVDYFKKHDTFDKQEFEEEVLHDPALVKSFQTYDSLYRREHEIDLSDNFDISITAVKRQARVFKSVLKLDKNFHIYIHGNRELIQQGVGQDGRKFYKIYFEEES